MQHVQHITFLVKWYTDSMKSDGGVTSTYLCFCFIIVTDILTEPICFDFSESYIQVLWWCFVDYAFVFENIYNCVF